MTIWRMAVPITFVLIGVVSRPDPAHSRRLPHCRTSPDTAAAIRPILLSALGTLDAGDLDEYGFKSEPDSLSLVADEPTCEAVIDAYNSHIASIDSARFITSAFVFTDGNAFILPIILPGNTTYHDVQTVDSTFAARRGFELLE